MVLNADIVSVIANFNFVFHYVLLYFANSMNILAFDQYHLLAFNPISWRWCFRSFQFYVIAYILNGYDYILAGYGECVYRQVVVCLRLSAFFFDSEVKSQ